LHKLKQESDTMIYERRLKFIRKLTFELWRWFWSFIPSYPLRLRCFLLFCFSVSLCFFVCLLHFMRNKLCVGLIRTMSPQIFRDGTAHQLKIRNLKVTTSNETTKLFKNVKLMLVK